MTATTQTTRSALNAQLTAAAEQSLVTRSERREAVTKAFGRGYSLTDDLVYNVTEAEELTRLWSAVDDSFYGDGVDMVVATARVADLEEERLLRSGFANRSASALMAAIEDVRKETVARWLRSLLVEMARNEAD
jgi:hypothetical protein